MSMQRKITVYAVSMGTGVFLRCKPLRNFISNYKGGGGGRIIHHVMVGRPEIPAPTTAVAGMRAELRMGVSALPDS